MAKKSARSPKKKTAKKKASRKTAAKKTAAKKSGAKKATARKRTASKRSASYPPAGKPAPDFTLPASDGSSVKLSSFKGKKIVVLFFYPRDMTSGCTAEACGFRDNHSALQRAGVEVFGVSPDSLLSHEKFIARHDLPYRLLADEAKKVLTRYGVWQEKSMYGRKYMGVARTTVVVDKSGRVAKVYEKVKPNGHPRDVLDFIREQL